MKLNIDIEKLYGKSIFHLVNPIDLTFVKEKLIESIFFNFLLFFINKYVLKLRIRSMGSFCLDLLKISVIFWYADAMGFLFQKPLFCQQMNMSVQ